MSDEVKIENNNENLQLKDKDNIDNNKFGKEKETESKPLKENVKEETPIFHIFEEQNEEDNMIFGIPNWKLFIYVFILITVLWMILAIGLGVGLR